MCGSALARSIEGSHQQREIARRGLEQQFLVDIPEASHIDAVHPTGIELMREVAFDSLPTLALQPLAAYTPDAPAVRVHRFLLGLLAFPIALAPLRFRDIGPQLQFGKG